ncbi:MAG: BON domain-containing protein, partial [Terriglobales bacterium]
MKKHLLTILFVLGLSAAVALAQSQPGYGQSGQTGQPHGAMGTAADQTSASSQASTTTDQSKNSSMANVDDESLHRQVHEQLASNPELQNVQITVKNGVVSLDGSVPNKDDKKEAKKLAKAVPGVKGVKEHLSIASSASSASVGSSATTGSAAGQGSISSQTTTTTTTNTGTGAS